MPPPGCTIHIDLLLPSFKGVETMLRISGKARVIRVDHPSTSIRIRGFAVVTDDLNKWGLVPIQAESEVALVGAGRAH